MRFGAKILFQNVNLQLNPGQHYGLVGANGCGKSTLIKIFNGETTAESGDVVIPSQTKLGTLQQNQFLYEKVRILDTVMMGRESLWQALQQKNQLLSKESFTEQECKTLDRLEKQIAAHEGYTAESEAAKLLEGLGLRTAIHTQPMSTLSGGYKLRVLLAQVLFKHPDLLLLDEPTNHLDIFSIKWLEEYLRDFPGTLLITSHDRDFLNGVCHQILDVDRGTIKAYKGNYDDFLEAKNEEIELTLRQLEKQGKRKEELQGFIDRFRAKATKARQAQSKLRLVEKMEEQMEALELQPSSRMYPKLQFELCRPSGARTLVVNNIHKSYGSKQVLHGISFEVERGERIGFLGANGIGKSTLLEILTKNVQSDSGTFEWGFAVQWAYFPQDHLREVYGPDSLLEWLGQFDRLMPEERLREILARVLFTGDDVKKSVSVLSGGETARLILAKMMLLKHNVLIFDEPTNHLDMEASESLLEALENYPGTLLFVSHNRHFISNVANRIIEMSEKGIENFPCSYAEYLAKREIDLLSVKQSAEGRISKETSEQKLKFQEQKSQRNLKAQLEKKIAAAEARCHRLEQEIRAIEERLSKEGFYQATPPDEQKKILSQKETLQHLLQEALEQWETVSHSFIELQSE